MSSTVNPLQRLLDKMSPEEKTLFATLANTTVRMLYTLGKSYRNGGKVSVKAGLSRRLELASIDVAKGNPKLKPLKREDLTADCGECEFLKRCRKEDRAAAVAEDLAPRPKVTVAKRVYLKKKDGAK